MENLTDIANHVGFFKSFSTSEYIVKNLDGLSNLDGMYVVTHSRIVAKQLLNLNPSHVRLGGDEMTLEQWWSSSLAPISGSSKKIPNGLVLATPVLKAVRSVLTEFFPVDSSASVP